MNKVAFGLIGFDAVSSNEKVHKDKKVISLFILTARKLARCLVNKNKNGNKQIVQCDFYGSCQEEGLSNIYGLLGYNATLSGTMVQSLSGTLSEYYSLTMRKRCRDRISTIMV